MKLSLANRFRGAFLGAALGEVLGCHCQHFLHRDPRQDRSMGLSELNWLEVDQWGFESIPPQATRMAWGRGIVQLTQTLIQQPALRRPLDLDRNTLEKLSEEPPAKLPKASEKLALEDLWAIAALPLALLHHENPDQLKAQLLRRMQGWSDSIGRTLEPVSILGVLLMGQAIALIMEDEFEPQTLIDQLCQFLAEDARSKPDIPSPTPQEISRSDWSSAVLTVEQGLVQLQTLLQQRASLTQTLQQFSENDYGLNAMLMALYSFLTIPTEPRLAMLQAARAVNPQLTGLLTGTLVGLHNGETGLPLSWRLAVDQSNPLSALWSLPSETALLRLADELLCAWAGTTLPDSAPLSQNPVKIPVVLVPRAT